jgi:S-adenosylmethionine hydrolase
VDQPISLDWPDVRFDGKTIHGSIVAKDSFGNLITDIDSGHLAIVDDLDSARILCGGQTISGIVSTYGRLPIGSLIALFGSSGKLEIAVVNGNAARQLGAEVGDAVSVIAGCQ